MVSFDEMAPVFFVLLVCLVVFNGYLGVPYRYMLSPFEGISYFLFGIDLHGVGSVLVASFLLLFFEAYWPAVGPAVLFTFFAVFIFLMNYGLYF